MTNYKKDDVIILKECGIYSKKRAKILEAFKDTYKILIFGNKPSDFKLIGKGQILRRIT